MDSASKPSKTICDRAGFKFVVPRFALLTLLLLVVSMFCACDHPPADDSANSPDAQKLPFDRTPRSNGISPSQSLIPSTTRLPEGTPIPVRLQSVLSSVSAHAGDTFYAMVDEPVMIDGQMFVARDTPATGRVLEAKAATSSHSSSPEPGYLRIVLVSLNIDGKPVAIETSSIFAKGGSREERSSGRPSGATTKNQNRDMDISFSIDRHLSFRLAQAVDLQHNDLLHD